MTKISEWVKVAVVAWLGSNAIACGVSDDELYVAPLIAPKLPDIVVRESDLYDHVEDTTSVPGRVLLRLSNGTANIGAGKLYLYGVLPANPDGTQDVMQRIYGDGGTFEDRLAGKFLFHNGHNHIHFVDWGSYRVRQILPGDGVGPILAEGNKTSFCIIDLGVYNSNLPGYNPAGEFHSCSSTVQGLSVGWVDVYSKYLEGQSIDITGLPAGQYWLESEVDPLDHVLESDETNNATRIKVTLGGSGAGPDSYEPNNARASVDSRPEGGPNSPNLGPVNPQRVIQSLSIDSATDVDWFKFYANHTGGAGDLVQIQFTHAFGDLDLELLDASGTVVASSAGTGNAELISLTGRPEGWYYARVFGKNGATNAAYTLTIDPPQNSAPSVTVTTPPAGNTPRSHGLETYTVQWTASDPDGDQTWVTVYVNTVPMLNGAQVRLPTSLHTPGAQGFYVINSSDFVPGTYWVYTEITDGGTTTGSWSPGTVSFTLVNDSCANATPITSGSTPFTTVNATTDGPAHAACNYFSNNQVGQDVWFRYQAECSGTVTISTCGTASYDTKLAVYAGATCSNLDANIQACVDDTSGCGTTSTAVITAVQGQEYLIRLGGYSGSSGSGTLQIAAPTCGPVCGNGIVEAGEECDGSAPSNQTCTAQCKLEFTKLVINEIYYDSPGADTGSYIEIAGPPGFSLTGYRLRFINGAGGVEYDAPGVNLNGQTIGASGYFLVVQDSTVTIPSGTSSMISVKANMQNGPDSVQLMLGTTIVDAVAYGTFGGTNIPAGEGLPAGNPGGTLQSLARLPNGADTANNSVDFGFATRTPGAKN